MISRTATEKVLISPETESARFQTDLLKRFLVYFKPYKKILLLMYVAALINVATFIAIPIVIQIGIDRNIMNGDYVGLVQTGALLLALLVLLFVAGRTQGVLMMKVGYRVIRDLRDDLFSHLQALSFRFFDTQKIGKLMSRITNDVQVFEELLRAGLDTIVVDVVLIISIIAAMLFLDPWLSTVLLFTIPGFAFVVFVLQRHLLRAGRRIQRELSHVNAFLNESIAGIRVIRAFAREDENVTTFKTINDDYWREAKSLYPLLSLFWQSVATIGTLGPTLVLLIGGILLSRGLVTIGVIAAFLAYVNRFFQPMQKISNMLNQVSRAMASAERIFEILDIKTTVADSPLAREIPRIQGQVEFQNVSFAYNEGEYVSRDLSFHVQPGETIAIAGPTGSGKTTIINLLCRFYDPVKGRILVDGVPLTEISQKSYRRKIALVMQDPHVFSGTIADNIRFGNPGADDAAIRQVAETMGIADMIESLPDGYQHDIGERGSRISLGQRQLLAFARALIRNPAILILDEASSYLDSESERLVHEATRTLCRGRTSFVIAHRLSTIQHADRILVLDSGRLVEQGSHTELLALNGLYANLVRTQYGGSVD
ncbi:MAG: ABC transporter ATP-binding protein [Spirochaetaceae bacterium]